VGLDQEESLTIDVFSLMVMSVTMTVANTHL
jgi:hypothetical protein